MTARASALVVLAAIHAAGAQSTREVRLDAGAAQVQQTGRDAHDAAGVLGLMWREGSPRFATLLSGALTAASDSASAAQASLAAAWRFTERSAWQTESGVTIATFGAGLFARGGSSSGFVRERYALEHGGMWAGGAFGGTTRDDFNSHSTALELGGWWRGGEFEWSGSVSRIRSQDESLMDAAGVLAPGYALGDSPTFDLTDLTADVRYEHGPLMIGASGTWRNGTRATIANQSAAFISAVWTLSPRWSIAVGTGRVLADPVRGVPDMQITSAALRVALVPLRASATAVRAAASVTLTPKASGALLTVRVVALDSSTVEVAGTFSDWKPVPLTKTAEGWEAEIALPPGRHRVAVRFNGGPWQAPRGAARMRDDFGGEAGLIVVP